MIKSLEDEASSNQRYQYLFLGEEGNLYCGRVLCFTLHIFVLFQTVFIKFI